MVTLDEKLGIGSVRPKGKHILGPGGIQQQSIGYDFTMSNIVLMVGSQILLLGILLMIVYFGVPPVSFPANAVRKMLSSPVNLKPV